MKYKRIYWICFLAFILFQFFAEAFCFILAKFISNWVLFLFCRNIILIILVIAMIKKMLNVALKINSLYVRNTKYFVVLYVGLSVLLTSLAGGYWSMPITYLSRYTIERMQVSAHFPVCDAVCVELKLLFD